MSSQVLEKICVFYGADNLSNLRIRSLCLVSFAGFLRCSEALQLRYQDLEWEGDVLWVNIQQSKTDQSRIGARIPIQKASKAVVCPYRTLKRYVDLSGKGHPPDPSLHVFRNISGNKLNSSTMSYSRTREIFQLALRAVGENAQDFGTHSLRSGGATQAAKNGANRGSQKTKRQVEIRFLQRTLC